MRKELKYKIRRTIFLYIPSTLVFAGMFVLACIKGGIFVINTQQIKELILENAGYILGFIMAPFTIALFNVWVNKCFKRTNRKKIVPKGNKYCKKLHV